MSVAQHLIRFSGEQIDGSEFTGTGTQCATLCQQIEALVPDCAWFVADLDSVGGWVEDWDRWQQKTPMLIGDIDDLVRFAKPIVQLIWGVFLAVPQTNMPAQWTREYWAEDGPPESFDGAVVELRAFDTSYFECYSSDLDLLEQLAKAWGVRVIPWDRASS